MMAKSALVTGITGQDGWYLAKQLLDQDYKVTGTTRGEPTKVSDVDSRIDLVQWDLKDEAVFARFLREKRPAEVYNLAAYASGASMYQDAVRVGEINGLAVARMLEAIRTTDPSIRFCQASSSELFGYPVETPQSETTTFQPRSPYGAAKLYAHEMVRIYRRRHALFACSAILFNHESARRSTDFVTGKVVRAAARISRGLMDELVLGNLEARRDWGFSGDYMRGMWMMLTADKPEDYVFATGRTHSVRELCECAFSHVGLDYRDYVREGNADFRPQEEVQLVGDAKKAAAHLNWTPQVEFSVLIAQMVDAELCRIDQAAR